MAKAVTRIYFISLLYYNIFHITSASCSTRSIDIDSCTSSTNCSTNGGLMNQVSSGIQLIIPVNFTCEGTITQWRAHIQGNATLQDNLIEFQIYEPAFDTNTNETTYRLVYGNPFKPSNGGTQDGSLITRTVSSVQPQYIPIMPGNIVGVYLPPASVSEHILTLLYTDTNDTVEQYDIVYYWTNVQNRTCEYSLSSAKVLRNVKLLLEWDFFQNSVGLLRTIVDQLKDDDPTGYCVEPSIHTTPSTTSTSSIGVATPTSTISMATSIESSSRSSSSLTESTTSTQSDQTTVTTSSMTMTRVTVSTAQMQTPSTPLSASTSSSLSTDTTSTSSLVLTSTISTSSLLTTSSTGTTHTSSFLSSSTTMFAEATSDPSSALGGLSNSLLTLFGTVLVLLFVIIILILILILIFMVTSKRKKIITYPVEAVNHQPMHSDKMELELGPIHNVIATSVNPSYQIMTVLEDNNYMNPDTKEKLPANSLPNHHDNSGNKNGGLPITEASIKQQIDDDYTEIDDNFQESSRKDYKATNLGEYCEPNIVFNSQGQRMTPAKPPSTDTFAVYESMYDDYDIPKSNNIGLSKR